MAYNIVSLFSGVGGMDLGFERAGFNVVVANERNKIIAANYRLNHPDTKLLETDIKNLTINDFPEGIDGIIGGPPCQSWSIGGNRCGINDDRGKLFYEYIRILKMLKPKFFVAENVNGMFSQKHNDAVNDILRAFGDAGYNVTINHANAVNYATAQNRKRIFFIGIRDDLNINFIFPKCSTEHLGKLTMRDVIFDLQDSAVPALAGNKHNPRAINNNEYFVGGFSPRYMSRNRVKSWNEPAFTVQASGRHCQMHPSAPKMINVAKDEFKFADGMEQCYRRMTVREVAAIQGFPAEFKFEYDNLNDAYMMIGNAVPINLAYEIAKSIKEALK